MDSVGAECLAFSLYRKRAGNKDTSISEFYSSSLRWSDRSADGGYVRDPSIKLKLYLSNFGPYRAFELLPLGPFMEGIPTSLLSIDTSSAVSITPENAERWISAINASLDIQGDRWTKATTGVVPEMVLSLLSQSESTLVQQPDGTWVSEMSIPSRSFNEIDHFDVIRWTCGPDGKSVTGWVATVPRDTTMDFHSESFTFDPSAHYSSLTQAKWMTRKTPRWKESKNPDQEGAWVDSTTTYTLLAALPFEDAFPPEEFLQPHAAGEPPRGTFIEILFPEQLKQYAEKAATWEETN
jgi:hypothetical protein